MLDKKQRQAANKSAFISWLQEYCDKLNKKKAEEEVMREKQ
jgi:hypothetical protein